MNSVHSSVAIKANHEDIPSTLDSEHYDLLVADIKSLSCNHNPASQNKLKKLLDKLPEEIRYKDNYLLWLSINLDPLLVRQASTYFSHEFYLALKNKSYDEAFSLWTDYANLKFYYLDRFANITGWLDEAEKLLQLLDVLVDNTIRSSFYAAYFNALLLAKPNNKLLKQWSAILLEELPKLESDPIKKSIYNHLILYNIWIGDMKVARQLKKESSQLISTDKQYPFNTLMQSTMFSMVDWLSLRVKESEASINDGLNYGKEIQIHTWNAQLLSQRVYTYLCSGDFVKAKVVLQDVEKCKDNAQILDNSQYHYLKGWLSLSVENYDDAKTHLIRALELTQEAGVLFAEAVIRLSLAQVYFLQNNILKAINHLARTQWIGKNLGSNHIRYASLLAQSWVMHSWGRQSLSSHYLKRALKLAAKESYIAIPGWPHKVMQSLLEKALHEGIEFDYVKKLIIQHNITPTGKYPINKNWPWKIQLRYSQEFQVLVDEEVLAPEGKSQQKPLDLIQLLTFYPLGLPKHKIIDHIYPEKDADKAFNALDATIFRARKLLKDKNAILSFNGRYALNKKLCDSDILNLIKIIEGKVGTSPQKVYQQFGRIKQLSSSLRYQHDPKIIERWLSTKQKSLREGCVYYLNQSAQTQSGSHKLNILKYIIVLDETIEASYQNLITALQQQNKADEAHEVLEQCKSVFHRLYGLSPSIKTQELVKLSNR